jgi:hypothetical protein
MLELDEAMDFYERTKRVKGYSLFYCPETNDFECVMENIGNKNVIPFIDSYSVCLRIIEMYLNTPQKQKYREECKQKMKREKNKVVSFLWFFECIDGAYNFDLYERIKVEKELKRWCANYNILYSPLEKYSVDPEENKWIIEKFGPIPE